MDLDQQLQILIDNAPNYGVPTLVIGKAIAPILKSFAQQLQCLEYYILQNQKQDWIMFNISNPQQNCSKTVIYAFTSYEDAIRFNKKPEDKIVATPLPTTHILFRLFSVKKIDSIIFFNDINNPNQGIELGREELHRLIQQQLEQLTKNNVNNIA